MRKKDIEKLKSLPAVKAERKYKMVAVAKKVKVGTMEHLIIDFYHNKKPAMNKPHLRIAMNDKEYANLHNGVWNNKGLYTREYTYLWNEYVARENTAEKSEIYVSDASKKVIRSFEKRVVGSIHTEYRYYHPLDSVTCIEKNIDYKKRERRKNTKQELMNKRMAAVHEIPDEFIEWSKGKISKGYMYYKRRNARYVDLLCSECGMGYTKAYKKGTSYESLFEDIIEPPAQNRYCKCKLCGASLIYKQRGKAENRMYEMNATTYLIEPYDDNGAVIRMFYVRKCLKTTSASEYIITEGARLFIGPNLEQRYWAISIWEKGKWYENWTWNNPGSTFNPQKDIEGYLWANSNITDTFLRYSQIERYASNGFKSFRPMQYAKVYRTVPELEMVYKLGMTELMDELLERGASILDKGTDFVGKLGIDKKNLKEFIRVKGNLEILQTMRLEHKYSFELTREQRKKLKPYYLQLWNKDIELMLKYMSITQFIHRIEKYVGMELPTALLTTCAMQKIKRVITTYLDYLSMRDELHHDLDNSVRVYPRELQKEHDILARELDKKRDETYIAERMEKYSKIATRYKELCKKYAVEFGGLSIRPATDAKEIIIEGRLQHHCVGKDEYLNKHNEGIATILFLRHKETPDEPYVTIEIKGNDIVQWYEAHDKKPHKDVIDPWLEDYKKYLKTGKKPTESKEELLVAAV